MRSSPRRSLAFGFVFVHPFEDGNGRIHRYLIHHVLAARGFNPPGVVFPVSATILDRIDEYRKVLESYSQRVLPLIKWKPTKDGNVEVLNDTADLYRYFDATPQAEFLYSLRAQDRRGGPARGGRLPPALRRLQGAASRPSSRCRTAPSISSSACCGRTRGSFPSARARRSSPS